MKKCAWISEMFVQNKLIFQFYCPVNFLKPSPIRLLFSKFHGELQLAMKR